MIKYCDLVMKGGITSGVIYPGAVCELSKRYHFKNIGGTSAGAIAAGATAAAEYRRRVAKTDDGYKKLDSLPNVLMRNGFLVSLFRPNRATQAVFQAALQVTGTRNKALSIVLMVLALLRGFPGLTVGTIIAAMFIWWQFQAPWYLYWTLGVAWTLTCAVAVAVAAALRVIPRAIHNNAFGLCNGFDPNSEVGKPPLVNWLYGYLNDLAGKERGQPLTFGDLWNAPQDGEELITPRAVNLEVMTTNLTYGTPYRLPFRDDEVRQFYFSPSIWRKFFPREVVSHLETHAEPGSVPDTHDGNTLLRLPKMSQLPVIVAIRMSLSFPILLSAVPLYAVDFSRTENKDKDRTPKAEQCWFSDGGICSNFPIHFFDAPLSRWPTFGINLKTPHPDYNSKSQYVWLPSGNGAGQQPSWNRFGSSDSVGALSGFTAAIIATMQNWRDNLQMRVPGYRNRIVHVSHTPDEGGLNLTMPPEVVQGLSERGREAGRTLLKEFNFENHAWLRYRSCLSTLTMFIQEFAGAYRNPIPQDSEVWPTIRQEAGAPDPASYKWEAAPKKTAGDIVKKLLEIDVVAVAVKDDGAPRPSPELRVVPKV